MIGHTKIGLKIGLKQIGQMKIDQMKIDQMKIDQMKIDQTKTLRCTVPTQTIHHCKRVMVIEMMMIRKMIDLKIGLMQIA
jgi:hypothetical protein